jgi:DNA-binding MarR family transcriptional regulator
MLATSRSPSSRVLGPRPRASSEETLEFLGALWAVDQELRALSKKMQRDLGVTGPQRLALRIIGLSPRLPASALAAALHLHPSTVTGLIARLTRKGLVQRRGDPADARRVLLVLTERGARINARRRGTVESAVSRSLGHLSSGQLSTVREVLERLRQSVQLERLEGPSW